MPTEEKEDIYLSFRRDALHLLQSLRVDPSSSIPSDLIELAEDTGADGISVLYSGRSMRRCKKIQKPSPDSRREKKVSSVAGKILDSIASLLTTLVKGSDDPAARQAREKILSQMKKIVYLLLSAVYEELASGLEAAEAVVGNMYQAIMKTGTYFATRNIANDIVQGYPRDTIAIVRSQIKTAAFVDLGNTIFAGLQIGLDLTLPGVGTIAKVVKSIMSFIVRLFMRIRETLRVNQAIQDARSMWDNQLYKSRSFAATFVPWYARVVADVPILACYVLGYNRNSNMYAFLAVTTPEGKKKELKDIKKTFKLYNQLVDSASEFARQHYILLNSNFDLNQMSIERNLR